MREFIATIASLASLILAALYFGFKGGA